MTSQDSVPPKTSSPSLSSPVHCHPSIFRQFCLETSMSLTSFQMDPQAQSSSHRIEDDRDIEM